MTFQGADVRAPLLAVSSVADKGNLTIFDNQGSYIIPAGSKLLDEIRSLVENTDQKIPLHRKNGVYKMRAWRLPPQEEGFTERGK